MLILLRKSLASFTMFTTNSVMDFWNVCTEESLVIALHQAGLAANRQIPLPVWFRGHKVGEFRVDLLVEDCVLLELKSARSLDPAHEAQLSHYLKSTEVEIGMLLNFGARLQFRRLIFDNDRKKIRGNPWKSV